jgi:hypothetical protein
MARQSALIRAIKLIESVQSEAVDWADKVRARPSNYGPVSSTPEMLAQLLGSYKTAQFKTTQLSVYRFTTKNGRVRVIAVDQNSLKKSLAASDDFEHIGYISMPSAARMGRAAQPWGTTSKPRFIAKK